MWQFPAETSTKLRAPSRSADARCPDTVVERTSDQSPVQWPVLFRTERLKRLSVC